MATIERTKDSVNKMIDEAGDAVVGIADQVERVVERAADSAAEHVTDHAHSTADSVRDGAKTASRDARRQVDDAAKKATRKITRAQRKLSRAAAATTDHVVESPWVSLLVAGLGGFLLGMLVCSRRRQTSI